MRSKKNESKAGKKDDRARVLGIRARNIQSVHEVEISDLGDLVEIRGDAGQGKTTILKAIEAALRGIDPSFVTIGADEAEIVLELSNATINRMASSDGERSSLMVKDDQGRAMPGQVGKNFLKALVGKGEAFNPVRWVQLGGGDHKGQTQRRREQVAQLIESLPLSVSSDQIYEAIDQELGDGYRYALDEINLGRIDFDQHAIVVCEEYGRAVYAHRSLLNDRVSHAENLLDLYPKPQKISKVKMETLTGNLEKARERLFSVTQGIGYRTNLIEKRVELLASISDRKDLVSSVKKAGEKVNSATAKIGKVRAEAEDLRERLKSVEERLARAYADLGEAQAGEREAIVFDEDVGRVKGLDEEIERLGGEVVDVGEVELDVEKVEEEIRLRTAQERHDSADSELTTAKEKAAVFTALVEFFRDDLPKALLAEADLPTPGLEFNSEVISIKGVPLHQLGTSEQIRIAVAIASAMNPKLGFIPVDGCESLGRADRLALAEEAKKQGVQLFMTFVDPSAKPSENVIVMDGGRRVT